MAASESSLSSREGASHRQTRILLRLGFGGLLGLMGVLGLSAISFLYQIEIRQERIRQDYVERDRTIEKLRSNIYLSGTYMRDFLIDRDETLAASHGRQFQEARDRVESGMSAYRGLLRPEERQLFEQLGKELSNYFAVMAPALGWTSEQRSERAYRFIDDQVLPRRTVAVGIADRIQQLSKTRLQASSEAVSEMFASFRLKLLILLLLTVALGMLLAGGALWRLLRLERESERRFDEVLHARGELKRLSAELVAAQESERRRISRELHDEVGQLLSAVMLGLRNLRSLMKEGDLEGALRQLQGVQDMTERNVSVVRNISLLLRPTMLDDLGLIPALKWLAREVSRTSALRVDVLSEDCPEDLPEEHRTCVFRVVQEAVRNASRHSGARHVRIHVHPHSGRLRVSVQDDGKGFDAAIETGLGILGMEERVVRLGGQLRVDSERGRGSVVSFDLPLPEIPNREPASTAVTGQEMIPFRTE